MLQLKVEAIKWELADTATFFLKDISGKKITYKAGQFITLVFIHHEEEILGASLGVNSPTARIYEILFG